MQPSTYLKMIAGSLPEHGQGAVDDSLRLLAQEALGVPQIHFLRSPVAVDGKYHYFAVPSSVIASEPSPATPLAMALPGHPRHQGPGAYVLDAGIYKVVALFDGEQLDIVVNESELVGDFLNEQTLPLVKVPQDTEAWRFQSTFTKRNQLIADLTSRLSKFSLAGLVFSGIAVGGLSMVDGWLTAKLSADNDASAKSIASVVSTVNVASPLAKTLAEYQAKTSVAVRAGGWVDAYEVKNGKESFRLFVPSWITPDYISSLGAGVAADRDPVDEQLLILMKGEPAGGKTITSAETVAIKAEKAEEAQGAQPGQPGQPGQAGPATPPVPALKAR
ncbi:ZIP zinc transporter [Novimethylophilus kurashikiensis]|uniref:ZIP zinc transporter n=1 Tax=Novimethylophilus kurashikiensis TaxID=1825523 RepID=A0A2R5FD60_9PROT|nr:hypothetical protein [Novimethylophilus kurashikiensis]GBG14611.1 ZIP zinc transporter [Novimethylophilus kurashikiensis]